MIDFGMADYCRPGQWLGERAGTPLYVAPEVLRQHYSTQADMWSAGAYVEGCRGSAGGGGLPGVPGVPGGGAGAQPRAMPCHVSISACIQCLLVASAAEAEQPKAS